MIAQQLRLWLSQRPFKPFRLVMSSGKKYEVRHPEMAWVTGSDIFVGVGEVADNIPADCYICPLPHVATVEPINAAPPKKRRTP